MSPQLRADGGHIEAATGHSETENLSLYRGPTCLRSLILKILGWLPKVLTEIKKNVSTHLCGFARSDVGSEEKVSIGKPIKTNWPMDSRGGQRPTSGYMSATFMDRCQHGYGFKDLYEERCNAREFEMNEFSLPALNLHSLMKPLTPRQKFEIELTDRWIYWSWPMCKYSAIFLKSSEAGAKKGLKKSNELSRASSLASQCNCCLWYTKVWRPVG